MVTDNIQSQANNCQAGCPEICDSCFEGYDYKQGKHKGKIWKMTHISPGNAKNTVWIVQHTTIAIIGRIVLLS